MSNIEIFCGLGGVGKTTMATSRALFLANQEEFKNRVLLITIDPAKRLKQVLNLSQNEKRNIHTVEISHFISNADSEKKLDVILMNSEETFKKIAPGNTNTIIKTLMKPHGGLNEIMSLIELDLQWNTNQYDKVILDTAPGKNFIDFLQSANKIENFFNEKFISLFDRFKNKSAKEEKKSLLGGFVKTGLDRLLSYLSRVTGQSFVEEFVDAVLKIYSLKDQFRQALKISKTIKDTGICFITYSSASTNHHQLLQFERETSDLLPENTHTLLNRVKKGLLEQWQPSSLDATKLKNKLLSNEIALKDSLQKGREVLEFHEILEDQPANQLEAIVKQWGMIKRL